MTQSCHHCGPRPLNFTTSSPVGSMPHVLAERLVRIYKSYDTNRDYPNFNRWTWPAITCSLCASYVWSDVMHLPADSRWRKRSTQTESSSLPCFIRNSTKSKNISTKVMRPQLAWYRNVDVYLCHVSTSSRHPDASPLLQMTPTILTRLLAPTRPNRASHIWWTWRRKETFTWIATISLDWLTSTSECSPTCHWANTVATRATPGCWSDLQS